MRDAMQLCAQCHGPQFRDYTHGSHGGMQGHWDLSRGPRLRNHCVDCHDPHTPQFQPSNPVLPPADRLLPPAGPSRPGFTVPRLSQEPHR
jgi:formate-dependent nitrite reductase cytochrome c552 subunit